MRNQKKSLNVMIPDELSQELEHFCDISGYSKTQAVMSALRQYIAIKHEEIHFKETNPNRRVRSRVVMEVMPRDDEKGKIASVMMY